MLEAATRARASCTGSLGPSALALAVNSPAGGDREASMYTIVQTAKLNGVNPEAYRHDTLKKIAEGHPINRIGELMPCHSPRHD